MRRRCVRDADRNKTATEEDACSLRWNSYSFGSAPTRDKRMNVRMSSMDMIELQTKAAKLGMPYQTLVASVLHQYLTGRLISAEV